MDIAAVGPDWGGAHPSKIEALLTSAPCHLTRVLREAPYRGLMGLAAGVGSQSPEPHLEDSSVYRPLRSTARDSNSLRASAEPTVPRFFNVATQS